MIPKDLHLNFAPNFYTWFFITAVLVVLMQVSIYIGEEEKH